MQPDLRQRRHLAAFHRSTQRATLSIRCDKLSFMVAALSNLSAGYNLLVVNLCLVLLEAEYDVSPATESSIATASLVGAVIGQLTFGYVGDSTGLAMGLLLTTLTTLTGALGSAQSHGFLGSTIFEELSAWRFVLGIGVGGVYPLAAGIAQRAGKEGKKGKSAALSFSFNGIGMALAPTVVLLLLSLFDDHDTVWRAALGLGAVPCIILISLLRESAQLSERLRILQLAEGRKLSGNVLEDGRNGRDACVDKNDIVTISLDHASSSHDNENENDGRGITTRAEATVGAAMSISPRAESACALLWAQLQHKETREKLAGTALSWFLFDFTFVSSLFDAGRVLFIHSQAFST